MTEDENSEGVIGGTVSDSAEKKLPAYFVPHLAKGAMINFAGALVRMVLVFGYTLLLARMLHVNELGQFFLMFTIVQILSSAALLGLDLGVVRFVAIFIGEGRADLARRSLFSGFLFGIPAAAVMAAAFFAASPEIAHRFMDESTVAVTALRIFAFTFPFWVTAGLANATTQGMHLMRYQVYSRDIGEQVTKFAFTAAVLLMGMGLVGVVWANLASVAIAAVMSMAFALTKFPKSGQQVREREWPTKRMLAYSLPLAFSNILVMVLLWVDLLLLGLLGTSFEAGLYGVALKVVAASSVMLTAFATMFIPVISDLCNRKQMTELMGLFKTINRWIFTCSFPIFLVLVIFAGSIMSLFGSVFKAGGTALILLAISQLINSSLAPAGLLVLMSGRSRVELFNMVVSLLVNVAVCFLLIPAHGIIGAALANVAATACLNILRTAEVWYLMKMHAYDRKYLKPLFAGAAGTALVLILSRFVPAGGRLVSIVFATGLVAAYALIMLSLGLNDQDAAVLRLIKKRILRTEVA
jgi:O-antigen/teichoic acid export membrane protein